MIFHSYLSLPEGKHGLFFRDINGVVGPPLGSLAGLGVLETELLSPEDSVPDSMFVEKPDESMISEFATQFDSTWDGMMGPENTIYTDMICVININK